VEVVGEMGRLVEAAGEGEFDPVNVSAQVHELDRLLEALGEARGLTPMSRVNAAMVVAPGDWWRRVRAWWGRRSR
jgi:hypothetical protein